MEMSKHTKGKLKRIISIFLVSLMTVSLILPSLIVPASAETADEKQTRIEEVREILNAIPYNDYLALNSDIYFDQHGKMPYGNATIRLTADQIDLNQSKLPGGKLTTYDNYEGKSGKSFLSPDEGTIAFNFTVPAGGAAALRDLRAPPGVLLGEQPPRLPLPARSLQRHPARSGPPEEPLHPRGPDRRAPARPVHLARRHSSSCPAEKAPHPAGDRHPTANQRGRCDQLPARLADQPHLRPAGPDPARRQARNARKSGQITP